MRFVELFVVITAIIAAANAAPTGNRETNALNVPAAVDTHKMVFDPKAKSRQSSRRNQQKQNEHQKRNRPCCDASLGLNIGAKLNVGGPAVDPAPVFAQAPPAPVNRNDRVGDSVIVIVDADHA
jgi:hypothetical protein